MEARRNKQQQYKFPKTALAFYIKLYCKQKGSSETKYKSNLIEATKSWVSLSEIERQQVYTKYKVYKHKFKLQCFDQLKNAEPFMKLKDARFKNVDLNTSDLEIQEQGHEEHNIEAAPHTETELDEQVEYNEQFELGTDTGPEQDQEECYETIIEPIDTNGLTSSPVLGEPLPPTLKTGKDLFHMLNSTDGANNTTWTSLPQEEKNQYSHAVLLLKKNYITKYREYLESLSPRALFDHYNNKKN